MDIATRVHGDCVFLDVRGDVDLESSPRVRAALLDRVRRLDARDDLTLLCIDASGDTRA